MASLWVFNNFSLPTLCHLLWRQGQHVARTRCSGPSAKVPAVMQENTTKKIQQKNAGNTENGLAALQLLPATLVRNERINAAFKIYDIYSARQRGNEAGSPGGPTSP